MTETDHINVWWGKG